MNVVYRATLTLALGFASLGALAQPSAPGSVVYGFEGLQVPFYSEALIPDGYAGATWSGWVLRRRDELQYTGLNGGSGAILAIGAIGAPQISFATPVVFNGVYGFYPNAQLSYTLYLGGQLVGSSAMAPAGGGYLASGYGGEVDRVVFKGPAGGFSIDDMGITPGMTAPVPEPASWLLMLAGISALGLYRQRRADGLRPFRRA